MEDILDKKEIDSLDRLNNRYEILTKPGHLAKLGERVAEIIPEGVKEIMEVLETLFLNKKSTYKP